MNLLMSTTPPFGSCLRGAQLSMGILRRGRFFNIWEQAIRASACQVAPNARLGTESRPATVPAALSAVSDQVPAHAAVP